MSLISALLDVTEPVASFTVDDLIQDFTLGRLQLAVIVALPPQGPARAALSLHDVRQCSTDESLEALRLGLAIENLLRG